jgi:hypothetical protein
MTAPSHTTETIERELAALGEAPPSAEELALLGESGEFDHVDVETVSRLAELAAPITFNDLSELEAHRGWRTVEQRLARPVAARPAESTPEPSHSRGGPQRWLFAAVGIAAAAALVLIVIWPEPEQIVASNQLDPKQVAELGVQARATLATLDDGASDTQRAEQSAAAYQSRLEESKP